MIVGMHNKTWTASPGAPHILTASGLACTYEMHIDPSGVSLTAWAVIPATHWDTEDEQCVAEETFPTVQQAAAWADRHDRLIHLWDQQAQAELDEAPQ